MHPTGKHDPDEPSGDLAVESDSSLPGPAAREPESGSEPNLTVALTPGAMAEPATMRDAPAPPTAFGRYEVRDALGSGGFGAVYLGHDTQLDRPVAIKVLRGGPGVPQAEADRFLQEARRLAQLSHPGIVAVHDVGLDGGQVYLVSDFLEGPDLGRWLRDHRPTWSEAARIAAALADALAHAHARLIVHRDVKPANIIVTPDRGPVLVDFGLGLDESRSGGSELDIISGTPSYMAPEQAGARPIGSTAGPTSTAWAWCSTRCSAAACRSGRPTPASSSGRCATTSRSHRASSAARSRPSWSRSASRRSRSGSRTATRPRPISPTT